MATELKLRRGTAVQHETFTGAEGELTYDSTNKRPVIHDGSTAGGFPVVIQNSDPSFSTVTLSGGQIVFPATQVPSADANTLDDYEEGTWTPVYEADTGAAEMHHSNPQGIYVKIGSLVFVSGYLSGQRNTLSGDVKITGLPYVCKDSLVRGYVSFWTRRLQTDIPNLSMYIASNTSEIELYKHPTNANSAVRVNETDLADNSIHYNYLGFSLFYSV